MKQHSVLFTILTVLIVLMVLTAAALILTYSLWSAPPESAAEPEIVAAPSAAPATEPPTEPIESTEPPTETEPEPVVTTVKLMAVGDNLIHNMVYRSGMGTDPWNYDHLYQNILKDTAEADVSVINQETMFVKDHANISNYPAFGTPREIGDAVYKAGFDVILHASNHTMDKGVNNIFEALEYWSDKDVTVLGIHDSEEDAATPTILEVNGIRLGLLNYTFSLNGFRLPSDKNYAVDLLDDTDKLLSDIAYCEEHADITIGFWHMGVEYIVKPDASAKRWTELTVAAGCDLLICAHPHVIQPYEIYTAENGNQALVYYSLGNFISAQDAFDRMLGGMAKVTIQKTVDGDDVKVEITDYTMEPLVTHVASLTNYTTYHLEDYTDTLGRQNYLVKMTTDQLWKRFYEIVGKPEE